jgi:hypothetical protein
MALSNNPLLKHARGKLGKVIVFKSYSYGTVISNYPDMSKVKSSEKQLQQKSRFRNAVRYAKAVLADEKKKAEFKAKVPVGRSVFHAAIKEFLKQD